MEFPKGLRYSQEHEWVLMNGDIATIGITDYAQEQLGDVVYVELPAVGKVLNKDDTLGVVESVKATNDLYSPVSGTVIEVNAALKEEPGLVNREPYSQGWMLVVKLSNLAELDKLITASEYRVKTSI